MACGGCQKRQAALTGALQKRTNENAAQRAARLAQRVGVVSRHATRDLTRIVKSTLAPSRRG